MKNFSIYIENGKILRTGVASMSQVPYQAMEGEYIVLEASDPKSQYVDDGRICNMPSRPSEFHEFDYTTKAWIDPRTLDDLRAAKWDEVKAARDAAEFGGFVWEGRVFDSDQISQGRITGAVQLAQMDPDFVIDWTLADNAVVQLDALQMQAIGAALGAHVSAQHARARTLREEIYAPGMTAEALAAITFSTEG